MKNLMIIAGIIAFSLNLNAQKLYPSGDELKIMDEMALRSFDYEGNFSDSVTNTTCYTESYGIKGSEVKIRINTLVWEKGQKNLVWLRVFEKGYGEPSSGGRHFTFNWLRKRYSVSKKAGPLNIEFIDNFWIHNPKYSFKNDSTSTLPGGYLILTGNLTKENVGIEGTIDIGYHIENLWLNRRSFWTGYPHPEEYKNSGIYSIGCEIIKLKNNSLENPY